MLPADESRLMLTRFEMAQLANLSIESVEEAKVLIPTCVSLSLSLSAPTAALG